MSAPASETCTCRLWSCLEVGPAPAPCISYPRPQVTLWMEKQNKALLYSLGSYSQHPGINHNEKNVKKDCVCTCITELLCCRVEINTVNQLYYQYKYSYIYTVNQYISFKLGRSPLLSSCPSFYHSASSYHRCDPGVRERMSVTGHGKKNLPEAQAGVLHSLAPNGGITWLSPKTAGPGGGRRHQDHHYSGIL